LQRAKAYGFREWGQLFNPRQLLALCTFGKWVREAYRQILRQTDDPDFAKAVATYLAFAWISCKLQLPACEQPRGKEMCYAALWRSHLHMVWDYAEINPLRRVGSWPKDAATEWLVRYLNRESRIPQAGLAYFGSAASLPFPDKHFDAVVIDPPYADNVPYADLSDFFYVWLRRTVGDLYPEAFGTELVPKEEEAVVNPARFGGGKKGEAVARSHYQRLMQKSFAEIYRVLQPDGMAVVMFTHRSTEAWERLMLSLLEAGLYPTASWPVHTEMEASTHQRGKGAIQSTILMACRRRPENAGVGWYAQVRDDLERVIRERLEAFWRAGIRGADFFVSAIGPAVGVFGKYRKVMHPDGREVTVSDLLDEARSLVTRFALEQLRLSTLDAPTRFYVLYRWAYGGAELSFDEANKLAKSVGAELDALAGEHHLVERRQDKVQTPAFARRFQNLDFCKRLQQALEDGQLPQLPEIDQVHLLLYLWRKGERENISAVLGRAGVMSEDHPLWRTAQALLEVQQNDQKADEIGEEVTVLAQLLGSKRGLLREVEQTHTTALQLQFFDDTVTPRRRRR
jgi:putative DNA methylase